MAYSKATSKAVDKVAVRARVKNLKKKPAGMMGRLRDLSKSGAFPSQKAK